MPMVEWMTGCVVEGVGAQIHSIHARTCSESHTSPAHVKSVYAAVSRLDCLFQ